MKTTILFLAVVLAIGNVSATFTSTKQKLTVLAELDARPIGSMVLSQLQIHLASEGVVDDVIALVQDLVNEMNQAQQDSDAKHNADMSVCDEQLTTTQAKYESHVAAAAQCEQTIAQTSDLLANAETELTATIDNIAELERLIAEGTALREQQAAAHVVTIAKHDKAIEAMSEAIQLVFNLHQGGSFVQLKSKIERVTEDLKQLNHLKEFDAYGPMVESLVQMSLESGTGDAVEEILVLLKALRTQIEDQKAADIALEESRIDAWAKELKTLTTQRANAVNRKGVLETNIDNYHTIIEDNQASLAMHTEEAARFLELNANWQTDCDNKQAVYDSTTAARTADLDVLNRLLSYLQEQVATMEDYLMERVN